jgi:hypothetical protein
MIQLRRSWDRLVTSYREASARGELVRARTAASLSSASPTISSALVEYLGERPDPVVDRVQ